MYGAEFRWNPGDRHGAEEVKKNPEVIAAYLGGANNGTELLKG
ncbi:MAG: hypothetical protein ACLTSZ_08225 [Lachnospiraceae bacterium]